MVGHNPSPHGHAARNGDQRSQDWSQARSRGPSMFLFAQRFGQPFCPTFKNHSNIQQPTSAETFKSKKCRQTAEGIHGPLPRKRPASGEGLSRASDTQASLNMRYRSCSDLRRDIGANRPHFKRASLWYTYDIVIIVGKGTCEGHDRTGTLTEQAVRYNMLSSARKTRMGGRVPWIVSTRYHRHHHPRGVHHRHVWRWNSPAFDQGQDREKCHLPRSSSVHLRFGGMEDQIQFPLQFQS